MIKTLRISFELRNAYKVNSVLYFIKQLPFIGKRLPDDLYKFLWIKISVQVVALAWELVAAFAGKALFLLLLVFLPAGIFEDAGTAAAFLHIFLVMTLIGGKMNTILLDADQPSYYAVLLLGMNAKDYTLINFGYAMVKFLVGYLIFGLIFGLIAGVPWWACLLLGAAAVGVKCAFCASGLRRFREEGEIYKENKFGWVLLGALLGIAYILPLNGIALPVWVSGILLAVYIAAGALSVRALLKFDDYRALHQYLWRRNDEVLTQIGTEEKEKSRKTISETAGITSSRRGFEYLNELFVKRHKKIMWRAAVQTALAAAALVLLGSGMLFFFPEIRQELELDVMGLLPVFAFVLYGVNRGTTYTQTLFMNCDHSLLTYSFYKQPKKILKLFQIRLREIIKVNLLPGTVIALGLPLLLYASGGTDRPTDYLVLFVSIISMNIFFSVHYLTIYYLLQPYNAGSELKSVPYQIATGLTYAVCYGLMMAESVPPIAFGICAIVFCVAYCVIACVLVYFLAPKTFRIRA